LIWNASSSGLLIGFVFQRLILLSVRRRPDHLINTIGWKRDVEAAQSKASNKDD
jgi:hypothetical protein